MPRRAPSAPQTGPAQAGIARLFQHGGSQAVRLPRAFRMPGKSVRVRRFGKAVVLEPLEFDCDAWWAEIDRLTGGQFLPEGRPPQPPLPRRPAARWR